MHIQQNIRNRSEARKRKRAALAVASMLGACAVCGRSVENHQYFSLGSVIFSRQPNSVGEFERLVSERRWNELMAFNEWKGDEDEFVIFALKCPSQGEITLKKVCDLAALDADSYLMEDIKLASSEQAMVATTSDGKWQDLPFIAGS